MILAESQRPRPRESTSSDHLLLGAVREVQELLNLICAKELGAGRNGGHDGLSRANGPMFMPPFVFRLEVASVKAA